MAGLISGRGVLDRWAKGLRDAGVIPHGCSRIIIDIPSGGLVKVYVEMAGRDEFFTEDLMALIVSAGEVREAGARDG